MPSSACCWTAFRYTVRSNGEPLTNEALDAEHGHFGPTKEFPDGIYHYHVTDAAPYINGDGFHGSRGNVSG